MDLERFFVETGAGPVAVRRAGAGSTVLLLHGLPGQGAAWCEVARRLATAHDVIVPDLLGFGGSARPATIEQLHAGAQAEVVAETLEQLHVARVAVVGHDFGGPVALTLHARCPDVVSQLGLFATNAFTDTPVPFPLSLARVPIAGRLVREVLFSGPALAAMLRFGTGRPQVSLDRGTYLGDSSQQRTTRTIFAGSLREMQRLYAPVERELGMVGVPTVVGWGDADPFFTVEHGERTAAAIAGARFRRYAGAGHFLPAERPAELAEDIARLVATERRTVRPATVARAR